MTARTAPGPAGTGPVECFDRWADAAFDHLRGSRLADRAMYTASELGDWSLLWHLLGTAQGAAHPDGWRRALRLSTGLAVESALVNGAVKSMFSRERPVSQAERPHRLRIPLTSSFPSGHASAAFFAATLLSERSRAATAYYLVATVVAASRVHVRIHHASDVVAGAALGLVLGHLARRLWPLARAR